MPFIAQGRLGYYFVVVAVLFSSGNLLEIRFILKLHRKVLNFLNIKVS